MGKSVAAVLVGVMALATGATARAADQSTAWMTNPRHDGQLTGSPLRPPLAVRWDVRLGEAISNVLVADGRVIYTRRDAAGAPEVTALDVATGAPLWSVATAAVRIAYDAGRVYATQGTGIAAFSPQTGGRLWTRDLESDYGVPHIVADGGMVYALMDEPGSRVAAVRGSDGALVWTSPSLLSGASAPAVDGSRVYVGLGGGRTFALDRATGAVLWQHETCCTGGSGTTPVLRDGLVYAEAWTFKVLDAASGAMVGSYVDHNGTDYSQPAFAGDLGIFRPATGLVAAGPDGATRWSFAAPAQRPVTAGGHAYTIVGSGAGSIDGAATLVALDLAGGSTAWCADLGVAPYPHGTAGPVSGGDGILVVPVDDRLVAFGNGGGGSTCGAGAAGAPAGASAPGGSAGGGGTGPANTSAEVAGSRRNGPRITLRVAATQLVLGRRTRLTGRVTRVARPAGRTVRIEADAHPFGTFHKLARLRTRADGTVARMLKPGRNVRVRAVLEGRKPLRTPAVTVWTDLPVTIRRLDAGGAQPRVRVKVLAPKRATIRRRRPVFYLAGSSDDVWERIAARIWTTSGGRTLRATAPYPAGRLGPDDRVLVCTRERRPDPYGRPDPLERSCGARRLPRAPTP